MDFFDNFDQKYIDLCRNPNKYPKFKIEVLDINENTIKDVSESVILDNSGSISISYQQGVRRSCSFSLININKEFLPTENSMFWYHRKFKLYLGLQDQKDGNIYWFSQGVYYTKDVSCEKNKVTINGIDKFGCLTSDLGASTLNAEYKILMGESIFQVIRDICKIDIGNDNYLDPKEPILSPTLKDVTLPYDLSVAAGGFLGDILIDLAMVLGADIFYNNDGHLCVTEGTTNFLYSTQGSQWSFSHDFSDYLSYTSNFDLSTAINKIRVWGEDKDGVFHYHTATNNNPKSPTRISLIGYRDGGDYETAMGYSDIRCQYFAEYYIKMKSIIQMSATINCTFLPHLDVNNLIDIYDDFFSKSMERHIIQSIDVPFQGTTMTITATNIAVLPYYTELE